MPARYEITAHRSTDDAPEAFAVAEQLDQLGVGKLGLLIRIQRVGRWPLRRVTIHEIGAGR